MTALDAKISAVSAVATVEALFVTFLNEASVAKQTSAIDPALKVSDFKDLSNRIVAAANCDVPYEADCDGVPPDTSKTRQFAVIETAARHLFDLLIASTLIDSPDFVKMWNLLDILSILSDKCQCDPALLFWLIEELLDSQTIAGCRTIFDYLESRRERITAKHFKQKNLVILRSCNELLRRLSRAEDTAFCGRVFIFLFQSFPLGDRSSVNLRGEFHVENVTTYETGPVEEQTMMDLDAPVNPSSGIKGVTPDPTKDSQPGFEPGTLYPLFWSLQESFSQPLKLFDPVHFGKFKTSLDATMKAFRAISGSESSQSSKTVENTRRNLRRKREEEGFDDIPETFNPRYLTSKDLFELEISDLSFRRHVLVQALIVTDFILTMSAGAKEKLANVNSSNKSVIYNDQLNEENTKWASETKASISDYLKRGLEGPYFYRMVETVLARDKNWVFWKMASCPPISRISVSDTTWNDSKGTSQRLAASKRLRPTPMGAVPMDFLRDDINKLAMDSLQEAERHKPPELSSFKNQIADDDFEISMPTNESTKVAAIAGKASKSWRAIRIAGRAKLAAFDKIDDSNDVDPVFQDLDEGDGMFDEYDEENEALVEENLPADRDLIIISGVKGAGKSMLAKRLLEGHKGVFGLVVRHTTRQPQDDEVRAKSFHFVTTQEFNQLRDGDRLCEYGTRNGFDYGTSTKSIETILESGKVPIIELDLEAAKFAMDIGLNARYILINPPSKDVLRERLANSGYDEAAIEAVVAELPTGADASRIEEEFNKTVVNDSLEQAVRVISAYIYGSIEEEPPLLEEVATSAVEGGGEQQPDEDEDVDVDEDKMLTDTSEQEALDDSRSNDEGSCIEVKL
ncbi:nuclear matrix protein [Drechmeria coniospora]|uniref:Nuclear matrix protein n=1 Tax=Drechmeria coniospora TaxID=98403 RepID=A0A151GFK9_DRECN|nr:nuclear matrix protein [Drechmeria coniospora]KYK55856.1 nuclear matrix protein [Drechmeria coniospora]ODA81554.1 hypothetical protein RJ55_00054 [Drechmeria coniospora]